jgi:RNA polymerase sigma factor (sigma-70 family)
VDQLSDEILMQQVQQDELQGMEELFERYHKRLYNFFLHMTSDRDLSLDMVQNVFYRLLKYRHAYRPDSKFRPWIYQVARNVHADHYRKQKMYKDKFADLNEINAGSDEEHHEQENRERLLHEVLAALPADKRELLVMSRFQGMKYEEIAQVIGCSQANVKVRVHRAMKDLKKLYFERETAL